MRSTWRGICSNNVVIQHSADGIALLLHPLEQMRAAQQSLLFSGNRSKQNRGAVAPELPVPVRFRPTQQPGAFDAHGRPGSVVIRARSIRGRIHHVRRPRIKVPRDDENRFRQLGIRARQNCIHILQRNRLPGSALRGRFEFVYHHLQLSAGIFRNLIQLRGNRITSAANPTLRVRPRRERQPRSAGHQVVDQPAHRLFINALPRDCSQRSRPQFHLRLPLRRFRGIARGLLRQSGHCRREQQHQRRPTYFSCESNNRAPSIPHVFSYGGFASKRNRHSSANPPG